MISYATLQIANADIESGIMNANVGMALDDEELREAGLTPGQDDIILTQFGRPTQYIERIVPIHTSGHNPFPSLNFIRDNPTNLQQAGHAFMETSAHIESEPPEELKNKEEILLGFA